MAGPVRKTADKIIFPDESEQTTAGMASKPPSGSYRVVNIYVDAATGKLTVEYEATPAP